MKVRCPYKCDYCLNPKGETNHWWLHPQEKEQFVLLAWDDKLADQDGHEHICSESCAAKALSKWMSAHLKAHGGHAQRDIRAGAISEPRPQGAVVRTQ